MKFKSVTLKNALKVKILLLCLTGFIFQTMQYLLLYWTYPTVMDIQEYIPTEIDLPGISFCNNNGITPENFCKIKILCLPNYILNYLKMCDTLEYYCIFGEQAPPDFTMVMYDSFILKQDFNLTLMDFLKSPVKEFLTCKIIQGDHEIDCNLDDIVIGSYYSVSKTFSICYTINSLWGNPTKKIQKIGKYDKIVLDFFVDMSRRGRAESPDKMQTPLYNLLGSVNAAIQLAVHSPYISLSPRAFGGGFLGGKSYQIKLKLEENNLLPPPYQTNCTDYMTSWMARGGIAPLNPEMAIEECKYNKTLELMGCVPFTVNYPHNKSVCKYCPGCKEIAIIADECSELFDIYNQPCHFSSYKSQIVEKTMFTTKVFKNLETGKNESHIFTEKERNCTSQNAWRQRCHDIKIEIVFDNFLVTNLTYNPKIMDLQLLSVIGGYMGIYLGVSFATTYDLGEWIVLRLCAVLKKKRKQKYSKNRVFAENRIELHSSEGHFRRRNRNPAFNEVY